MYVPKHGTSNTQDAQRTSICGHSMGGHGALIMYLRETGQYKSVSAFAPISHPTQCPWGKKAFVNYLEGGVSEGKAYDAAELLAQAQGPVHMLVDCGTADNFYKQAQLQPETLIESAKQANVLDHVCVRLQDGYDHSCA